MRSLVLAMVCVLAPIWSVSGQEQKAPVHTVRFQIGANSPYYADYYGDSQGKLRLGKIREIGQPPAAFSGKFLDQADADKRADAPAVNPAGPTNAKLADAMRMLDPGSGGLVDDRIVRAAAANWLKHGDLSQWLDYLIRSQFEVAAPAYGRYGWRCENSGTGYPSPACFPAWSDYYCNFGLGFWHYWP